MKIVERYGPGYRMAAGRGVWAVPVSGSADLLAGVYGLVRSRRARAEVLAGTKSVPRRREGARPAIVSIGNIEAGGGGKTPFAIAVARGSRARRVRRRGRERVRGERRRGAPPASFRRRARSRRAGRRIRDRRGSARPGRRRSRLARARSGGARRRDLIYRDRGVSVIIDPRRGRGIELARRLFSPSHVLLDDAFQNFSVAKDVDILLLDAEAALRRRKAAAARNAAGTSPGALRADIVVFTRAREERVPEAARRYVGGEARLLRRARAVRARRPERRDDPARIPRRQGVRALLGYRPSRIVRSDDRARSARNRGSRSGSSIIIDMSPKTFGSCWTKAAPTRFSSRRRKTGRRRSSFSRPESPFSRCASI